LELSFLHPWKKLVVTSEAEVAGRKEGRKVDLIPVISGADVAYRLP
jgi:hypothetical protein